MAIRYLRQMSSKGDTVLKTWDTETVSPDQLKAIENEFNAKTKAGYFAADITDGKNEIITTFNPNADTLLLPRMVGG